MAGKFEITKAGDGTFSFEFLIDGTPVAQSPVFEKEDACRRGVKAVKKNSRMKVQNAFAGDEEKTNPKYLVEPAENGARFTLFLQTGEPCLTGTAADEAAALAVIEQIGNNANAAQMAMAEVVLSENELRQIRLNKLQALQEAGQDPFQITKAEQTHHTADVRADFDALENTDVTLCGRMMSRRDMGKANFVDLSDRTGRMQIYVRMNDVGEDVFRAFKKWDIGDLFQVTGFVFKTRTGEISVHAKELKLLTKSLLLKNIFSFFIIAPALSSGSLVRVLFLSVLQDQIHGAFSSIA